MKNITGIEDLADSKRVPKPFFDYVTVPYAEETSAPTSTTCRSSVSPAYPWTFQAQLSTTILGEKAAMPLILAPIGSGGLQYMDGEIYACRAAQKVGIPYTLSTMSICSIEDVAANVDKPFWFQLYMMKDRGFAKALIERAIAAKCSALVLTVDLQVLGQRHADVKNGLTVPPKLATLKNLIDFATKPSWVMGMLKGKSRNFGNITGHVKGTEDLGRHPNGSPRSSTVAELEGRRVDSLDSPGKSSSRVSSISSTHAKR